MRQTSVSILEEPGERCWLADDRAQLRARRLRTNPNSTFREMVDARVDSAHGAGEGSDLGNGLTYPPVFRSPT